MLTIHHLGQSQSERIVWLCEELGIAYRIERHERDPVTRLAPPSLRAMHPLGNAPVIADGDLVLAESGAIVEYIVAIHGEGRLVLGPDHPDFAAYLYWLHFSNANLQSMMGRCMVLRRLALAPDNPTLVATQGRLDRALGLLDTRLLDATWLAGSEFTIADIMIVFSLTTMRLFLPLDLAPYPNIKAYLARIGDRAAYRRAMAIGDPGLTPLLT